MAKRYVLFMADDELEDRSGKELAVFLQNRVGPVKVILLRENPRALIVKTDGPGASTLRSGDAISFGGRNLTPVLTSGAIGKLKRRALGGGSSRHGQVSE